MRKFSKINIIIISLLFLLTGGIASASDVYGYRTGTASYFCFSSLESCKKDLTSKNITSITCGKLDEVTSKTYCPNMTNSTSVITPSGKPWYFTAKVAGTSFAPVGTYATLKLCTEAYNNYIKEYPNKELTKCATSETPYDIAQNAINATQDTIINNKSYTLLAPLPGLSKIDSSTNIGDYFSLMVKIAIGICGVLAVIMIVIGGIQYMGDESIFGKTQAKSQITKAIFGLLIAVGSYALLNTINPELLGTNGLTIKQASGEIEQSPWETYEKGDYLTADCPSGFIDINVKYGDGTVGSPSLINVCKDISNNLIFMINAAYRNAGIKLSGYGSRSIKTQENLRAQHCGGTAYIYVKTAKCSPATAIPGTSNHEKGLAVDFRCNGQRITSTDNVCYKWLKENAGSYLFKNNYSRTGEAWHWSTTGN